MDPQKALTLPQIEQSPPASPAVTPQVKTSLVDVSLQSKLGTEKDMARGEPSGSSDHLRSNLPRSVSANSRSSQPDLQPDSSDVESSDSDLEEGEFSKHELDFEVVRNRKRFSGQKGKRGRGPKIN